MRGKVKACEEVGVYSEKLTPPETATTSELLAVIDDLNRRDDIDGILVQLPLPPQVDSKKVLLAVDPAKDVWKRPRPHLYSNLVKPVVPLSKSGSYPSGHATVGTLMAIVLSNMVPEKRAELMARGWEYANNRVIGGIHYRSDIEAGRIAGSLIAEAIWNQSDFAAEFAAAKAELRAALGLQS